MPLPHGIDIAIEQEEQRLAVEALHRLAFGGSLEAAVVSLIRQSPQFIPDLSLVARRGDEILGHVLFSRVQVRTDAGTLIPVVLLAPLAVQPQWAGVGIGSALVRTGLERLNGLGEDLVVVRGHPNYYQRLGFQPAEQEGLHAPSPLPQLEYSLLRMSDTNELHGTLVYPPAFRILGYPTET